MRTARWVILFAVAMTAVLAAGAPPAFAGSSSVIYGEVSMESTVSLEMSGSPLVYRAHKGETTTPTAGTDVTITNTGEGGIPVLLGFGSSPTDGADTWNFADATGPNDCIWMFSGQTGLIDVPSDGDAPRALFTRLPPGEPTPLLTYFAFPTVYKANAHAMSALIIVGESPE
ncbi:MAG TPA: hypothetical protein VIK32_03730 [Candidatus Limnocylindrales bacterium]